jgi:hypothetical protein
MPRLDEVARLIEPADKLLRSKYHDEPSEVRACRAVGPDSFIQLASGEPAILGRDPRHHHHMTEKN